MRTRCYFFPALVLLIGCAKPPAAAPTRAADAGATAPLAGSGSCTLATPLVPGVPGSPGHLMHSDINPNGQSQLAAHMRSMQAQLKATRAFIERGEKGPPLAESFARIRCLWPTVPADRNEQFDQSAQVYLSAVTELDQSPAGQAAQAYDQVLTACRMCHEKTCSGAIVAIEALRLPQRTAP